MNRPLIAGALAVVAVFAGIVWFARDSAPEANDVPAKQEEAAAQEAKPPAAAPRATQGSAEQRPTPADPRLAALMRSPDNALIEFLADPEGRVIKEVDNDSASPSYRKPLREYTYAGDKVIRLVKYQYSGDQTQVVTADVVYRADGSVDQYNEATRYEYAKK